MAKNPKTTIHDVAREARVSISTVSRVFSGAADVADEKRRRVCDAALRLGYEPDVAAQRLSGGRAFSICIVAKTFEEQAGAGMYFKEAIGPICEAANQCGYDIHLNMTKDDAHELTSCTKLIQSRRVDGFILLTARHYDPIISLLLKYKTPFTLTGRIVPEEYPEAPDAVCVNTNNIVDARAAVQHIIDRGRRVIAVLYNTLDNVIAHDRFTGYRQALYLNNIPFDEELAKPSGYAYDDTLTIARELVARRPDIDGVFATEDIKAIAMMQALREAGRRVPQDVAVVGYNDYDIARICQPNLTTVRVPIREMAALAAKKLFALIEGKEVETSTLLPTSFIVRDSV